MDVISRDMKCSAAQVFQVIDDGWLFALWVVGASCIRDVEENWPEVGSQIHHSVGSWPILVDDTTRVLALVPGESIEFRARAWPAGEAKVVLSAVDTATGCRVSMVEDAVKGPALLVPQFVRQASLRRRNAESLRRLSFLAEGRVAHQRSPGRDDE